MNDGEKENKTRKISLGERIQSFKNAFSGLRILILFEHNFRIHLIFLVIALTAGLVFKISAPEWIAVIISIGFVLAFEAINTAVEYLSDSVSADYDEKIKRVKDVAAAGVLISAVTSIVTGLIIFLPKVISFIRSV
jgi:diacylglycerol kinase